MDEITTTTCHKNSNSTPWLLTGISKDKNYQTQQNGNVYHELRKKGISTYHFNNRKRSGQDITQPQGLPPWQATEPWYLMIKAPREAAKAPTTLEPTTAAAAVEEPVLLRHQPRYYWSNSHTGTYTRRLKSVMAGPLPCSRNWLKRNNQLQVHLFVTS